MATDLDKAANRAAAIRARMPPRVTLDCAEDGRRNIQTDGSWDRTLKATC
ncbi:hypothetical protein [Roseisalinus antarcticus]|uniref:Uncharacterized protein n=1 Tax=Roseisalinus antarcticus TaxID=254357 RepID=A0A1Y5TV11_9RHOB|nr:hypothetical protein [Roseisalinus antarcticus]SLN70898.1 hypothetical protein ROA7023_03482 [Roseisalinus antarcticus]